MSKTKQKEKSEVEMMRGKIRKLESTVRRLRKENRALSKKAHIFENVIDEVVDHIDEPKEVCKECGKGSITEYDFTYLVVKTCDLCGHQRKIRPRSKK